MKILVVSRSFHPMISPRSFRTTELVKELAKQGNEVTLFIPERSEDHNKFEKEYGVFIKNLGQLKFKTFDITKGNRISVLFKRVINRMFYQLFFYYPTIELMFQVKRSLQKEHGYDLLISIAAPHSIHWGTAWALAGNKKLTKRWIADCGDPFMMSNIDSFNPPFYFKYLELYWNKTCDFITVPFQGAVDGYYKKYRYKIKIIPQGFNFDEVAIQKVEYKKNTIPTFAYAGGFIPGVREPGRLYCLFIDFRD